MSFLYLFDMVDFDKETKNVCETNRFTLEQARSNYLYLVSKYNQNLLKEKDIEVPEFFKEGLSDVLQNVEKGGDFEKAKGSVLKNCLPEVKKAAQGVNCDEALIIRLNELVAENDKQFASKFSKAVNNLQLSYIITQISGRIFDETVMLSLDLSDKKSKSNAFKNVIKYNGLMATADKVKQNEISASDYKVANPVIAWNKYLWKSFDKFWRKMLD